MATGMKENRFDQVFAFRASVELVERIEKSLPGSMKPVHLWQGV
jgi:hypothetical protein